ncbi:MAG TPA: hypothetical protein VMD59_04715 [Acidimicrobiales bacterium]|nr:hypothetical protein [Acidimicrobiales bacterium]
MQQRQLIVVACVAASTCASALVAAGAAPAGASAAPARASTSRSASIALEASGEELAFWRGQDGDLWEATSTGGHFSGPTRVGFGPLGSEPSVAIVDGEAYVFWEGRDAELWTTHQVGSGWAPATAVQHMGPMGSRPSVTTTNTGLAVLWKGRDGDLWEATCDVSSGAWSGPTDRGYGPLGSAPSVDADDAGNLYAFWQASGSNTHVMEAWYDARSGSWSGPIDLGQWTSNTASAPSVTVFKATGHQYLFWQGLDRELWEARWNGHSWVGPTYVGKGPLDSQPAVASIGDEESGTIDVAWRGTPNLDLWSVTYHFDLNSWTAPSNDGLGPLG